MTEKEGGTVKKGHEEGLKMAISLLEEFGLPLGLLSLANVSEIVQTKKVEHNSNMIGKLVSYDTEIQVMLRRTGSRSLRDEIIVDEPPTGKIHFKSLAGITKTFLVEAFAAGQ
ncbi:hypothetical protein NMG60_11012841 [Bertholletia excelsa]